MNLESEFSYTFQMLFFHNRLEFHSNIQHYLLSTSLFLNLGFPLHGSQSSTFSSWGMYFLKLHNLSSPSFGFICLAPGLWFFMFTTFSFLFLSRRETKRALLLSPPLTSTLNTQLFISSVGLLTSYVFYSSIHPEMHAAPKSKQLHQWLPTLYQLSYLDLQYLNQSLK